MNKVSFLIVNYNSAELLSHLVISINKYFSIFPYEILIFNNSNNEIETKKLNELTSKEIAIYGSDKNIGFVAANNYLFNVSTGNVIVLINPDVLFIDNSFNEIVKVSLENMELGVVGPKLLNHDLSYQVSFSRFPNLLTIIREHIFLSRKNPYSYNTNNGFSQEVDVIKGCCMVLRRELIIGDFVFDPDFEMYSEELDLCKRLADAGRKNFYYPQCSIIHFGEKSSGYSKESLIYSNLHYHQSKLIYFKKHHNAFYYFIVKIIIYSSLVERTILLYLFGKRQSSKIFYQTLKKLISEKKDLPNM